MDKGRYFAGFFGFLQAQVRDKTLEDGGKEAEMDFFLSMNTCQYLSGLEYLSESIKAFKDFSNYTLLSDHCGKGLFFKISLMSSV